MPSTVYNSTDTPKTVIPGSSNGSNIVVSDVFIVTDIVVNIQISAPDEGGGPDPTLVEADLDDLITTVILHNATASSIANKNYNTTTSPPDVGSLTSYVNLASNKTWSLTVNNFSFMAAATINSWALTLSYNIAPTIPLVPTAPSAIAIPSGIRYGSGVLPKKNINVFMNLLGNFGVSSFIDKAQRVPFNSKLHRIKVAVNNTGVSSQTNLSLYKYSSGVITTLINQGISIPSGNSYTYITYNNRNANIFNVNEGDVIFASVDPISPGVQDLSLMFNLSEQ